MPLISDIYKASGIIKNGGVVAFPTETVYGLGADATNFIACNKIYDLKNRPKYNPLIVHVQSIEKAQELCLFDDQSLNIAKHFWPGPLTIILSLKSSAKISSVVTAGLNTLAIRIPDNEIALKLIEYSNTPIAAPSANVSNYVSPTTTDHVINDFGDIPILQGKQCLYGIESTIIDFTEGAPTILRSGFITEEDVSNFLKIKVSTIKNKKDIKSPGMLNKHYSPKTKIRINAIDVQEGEIGLGFGASNLNSKFNLSPDGNLIEVAYNLYHSLRKLDQYAIKHNIKTIAIAKIPNEGIGKVINDKLNRASSS